MRQADRLTMVAGTGKFALTLWPAPAESLSEAVFVAIDHAEARHLIRSLQEWMAKESVNPQQGNDNNRAQPSLKPMRAAQN